MATCGDKFPFISADWYGPGLGNNPNGPCSGNGICNNITGLCECFEGFTGLSDLINTIGLDCQINNLAVQLEWAFVVLLACLFQFQTRDRVVDRIRQHYEIRAQRLAQGKKYRVWKNNRTLIAMLLYSFGCFPSIFILGVLRIAKADERAGVTIGYSLLFFTGKVTFYLAALIFQPALLGSLLSGGKSNNKLKIARMIRLGYITQYVTFTFSVIAAVAPLVIIADPSKGVTQIAQIVYIVYFVLQALSMIILFCVSYLIKKRAKEIFFDSYNLTQDKRTKELGDKVDALEKKALISSSLIGAIYVAFIIFPTLWNKHDYVFPLTWLPFVVIGKEINNQHVKTHGSSSKGSGGSSSYSEGESKTKQRSFRTIFRKKEETSSYITPGQSSKETMLDTKKVEDEDDGYV